MEQNYDSNDDFQMVSSSLSFLNNQLCYIGQKCQKIPETLSKLHGMKTESLDLSYNELVTLKGLEGFPFLKELILDNNELSDTIVFPYLPHLNLLSLNNNKIYDIESLLTKIEQNFPLLTYLSLLGNKACPNELANSEYNEEDYQRYRYFVLHYLPNLKFLDSTEIHKNERIETSRIGKFMKIIRPLEQSSSNSYEDSWENTFSPLPRTMRNLDDRRGASGKFRKFYNGKHSEGNRFISDNEL